MRQYSGELHLPAAPRVLSAQAWPGGRGPVSILAQTPLLSPGVSGACRPSLDVSE